MYDEMLCPDCHEPSWISYDESRNSGEFEMRTLICEGCRVREVDRRQEPAPGEKPYLHNHITAQD